MQPLTSGYPGSPEQIAQEAQCPRRIPPGVFCLETLWARDLTDDSSVRPVLETLGRRDAIRFIHRDVGTGKEFDELFSRWLQKRYDPYAFCYLAFHGTPGTIVAGDWSYSLEYLADVIDGRAEGRIFCFGSCNTLKVPEERLDAFLRSTKARAICGYENSVDWVASAAFEMLLISAVAGSARIDTGFKRLDSNVEGLVSLLGFRAAWRGRSGLETAGG